MPLVGDAIDDIAIDQQNDSALEMSKLKDTIAILQQQNCRLSQELTRYEPEQYSIDSVAAEMPRVAEWLKHTNWLKGEGIKIHFAPANFFFDTYGDTERFPVLKAFICHLDWREKISHCLQTFITFCHSSENVKAKAIGGIIHKVLCEKEYSKQYWFQIQRIQIDGVPPEVINELAEEYITQPLTKSLILNSIGERLDWFDRRWAAQENRIFQESIHYRLNPHLIKISPNQRFCDNNTMHSESNYKDLPGFEGLYDIAW